MATLASGKLSQLFEDFLKTVTDRSGEFVYRAKISQMIAEEGKSLTVDFGDILRYNGDLANRVILEPDSSLEAFRTAAFETMRSENALYADRLKRELAVRIRAITDQVPLRKVDTSYLDKLLSVAGMVVRTSELRPLLTQAAWVCQNGHVTMEDQDDILLKKPVSCELCGELKNFELDRKRSKYVDFQIVRIQELPEELPPGQLPQFFDVNLEGDIVNLARPGDRVVMTGIVRAIPDLAVGQVRTRLFKSQIDCNHVEVRGKEPEIVQVTKEDESLIRSIAGSTDAYERLIGSMAPAIMGHASEKEAVLLLLVGGSTTALPDGTKLRGDLNILLVGDPGTGKSELLKFAAQVAPRGIFASGRGTSLDHEETVIIRRAGTVQTAKIGDIVDGYYPPGASGAFVPVTDLECVSYHQENGKLEWTPVSFVFRHRAEKQMLKLKLQTGREVVVTDDHSLYSVRDGLLEDVKAGDLGPGDCVAIPGRLPLPQVPGASLYPSELLGNVHLAKLLGYYVAEGYLHEGRKKGKESYRIHFELDSDEVDIIEEIRAASIALFGRDILVRRRKDSHGVTVTISGKRALLLFRDVLSVSKGARNKRVPAIVYNMPRELQVDFLTAYVKGDRGVTSSPKLMSDLQYLMGMALQSVGKFSVGKPSVGRIGGRTFKGGPAFRMKAPNPYRPDRRIQILGPPLVESLRPLEEVLESSRGGLSLVSSNGYKRLTVGVLTRMLGGRRGRRLGVLKFLSSGGRMTATQIATNFEMDPRSVRGLMSRCEKKGLVRGSKVGGRRTYEITPKGDETARRVEGIRTLVNSDLRFAKVRTIEKAKPTSEFVYDFSVSGVENFIGGSGGVLCHNTAAGLSAAVIREKNVLMLEAGVVVLADQGIACLAGETEVYTGTGLKPVEQIWSEASGPTLPTKTGREAKRIIHPVDIYDRKQRADIPGFAYAIMRKKHTGEMVRLTFASGLSLTVTPEHLLKRPTDVKNLWVRADQVEVGDELKAPVRLSGPPVSLDVPRAEAYVLGCTYGDGWLGPSSITISQSKSNQDVINNIQNRLPGTFALYDKGDRVREIGKYLLVSRMCQLYSSDRGLVSRTKFLLKSPSIDNILMLRDDSLWSFFAGVFDTDGDLNHVNGSVVAARIYPAKQEHELRVLLYALRRLGVYARIRGMKSSIPTIQITGSDVTRFVRGIADFSVKLRREKEEIVIHHKGRRSMMRGNERVARVERIPYDGYVYDFSVGAYHNYESSLVYVHNCIDEFDKMNATDRTALHESMEQQTITIAKAGIYASLNARTAILAACNPVLGRYNPFQNLTENIETLPIPLLTRFDLIFVIRDQPAPAEDDRLASHILSVHEKRAYATPPPVEFSLLKKYISYSKKMTPTLTKQATERIKEYYLELRRTGGEEGQIPPTPRTLESLIRVSTARAKLLLKEEVTEEDALAAIALMNRMVEDVLTDATTKKPDFGIQLGKPAGETKNLRAAMEIFRTLEGPEKKPVERRVFKDELMKSRFSDDDAEKMIRTLFREGMVYESKPGFIRRLGG